MPIRPGTARFGDDMMLVSGDRGVSDPPAGEGERGVRRAMAAARASGPAEREAAISAAWRGVMPSARIELDREREPGEGARFTAAHLARQKHLSKTCDSLHHQG
jgi:hypothetical protein